MQKKFLIEALEYKGAIMRQLDFNCFSGNWPFHKIRSNSVDKLCLLHRRCGIEGGFISSFEAIFYQDPYEAELELAKQLEGKSYYHVMVVIPTLPAWKSAIFPAAPPPKRWKQPLPTAKQPLPKCNSFLYIIESPETFCRRGLNF